MSLSLTHKLSLSVSVCVFFSVSTNSSKNKFHKTNKYSALHRKHETFHFYQLTIGQTIDSRVRWFGCTRSVCNIIQPNIDLTLEAFISILTLFISPIVGTNVLTVDSINEHAPAVPQQIYSCFCGHCQ